MCGITHKRGRRHTRVCTMPSGGLPTPVPGRLWWRAVASNEGSSGVTHALPTRSGTGRGWHARGEEIRFRTTHARFTRCGTGRG